MTTRETIDGYFSCMKQKKGWEPVGPAFGSDVAEVFGVRDGRITSFDIYFDSSPFPK